MAPGDKQEVTPEFIIQIVADHFNLTPLDIMSAKRSKEIVYPRQIVMYLCRTMTETGLQNIGKALGAVTTLPSCMVSKLSVQIWKKIHLSRIPLIS